MVPKKGDYTTSNSSHLKNLSFGSMTSYQPHSVSVLKCEYSWAESIPVFEHYKLVA